MQTPGDRIKHLRAILDLTQDEFARLIGVSRGAVGNWERSLGIKMGNVVEIAEKTGASADWIANGRGAVPQSKDDLRQITTARTAPLVSWVSAGGFATTEQIENLDDCPRMAIGDLPHANWIALEVIGDSMDRISPPGSIIFVDCDDKQLVPNACYVVATAEGSATYKRFRPNPDRFEPVSINPVHEPIFPDGEVRVIGRVKRSVLPM